MVQTNSQLNQKSQELNCISNGECAKIQSTLNYTNLAFGFLGFMLGLGFFILFFNRTEEKILKKLEQQKEAQTQESKFQIILKALDNPEQQIMKAVKEQDGITQNTLMLRTNLSKTKISYVLQELEKRNLIKRIPHKKTKQIFLRI